MDQKLIDLQERRLARARWYLHNHQPFFCRLGQSLKTIWCEGLPTAGVDANGHLYFNPKFAERCSDTDLVFVYAHEVMHIVQMCHGRAPMGVIHKPWNIAADACINKILIDDCGFAIISKSALEGKMPIYGDPNSTDEHDQLWHKLSQGTTEQGYYYILKNPEETMGMSSEEMQNSCPSCGGNHDGDGHGDGNDNEGHSGSTGKDSQRNGGALKGRWWDDSGARISKRAEGQGKNENGDAQSNSGGMSEEQRQQWTQRIASAACAAKTAGKMPGILDQFVTTLLTPKRDWKNELRAFCKANIKGAYSWRKLGRRCLSVVRTPGRLPTTPTAVVYIDTSGSMSDQELRRCLSETYAIAKLCNAEVHLILGDAEIYFSGVKKMNDLGNLKEVQRGGTDFTVLFDHIEKEFRHKPTILIGFTDLCGPFPDQAPSYPVVWCRPLSGYKGQAPWGKMIEVEL